MIFLVAALGHHRLDRPELLVGPKPFGDALTQLIGSRYMVQLNTFTAENAGTPRAGADLDEPAD